jgi:hypothetical protein
MAELAPDLILPESGKPLREIAAALHDQPVQRLDN